MAGFSLHDLEEHFNRIGCRYRAVGDNHFYSGLRGSLKYYSSGIPIEITVDSYWVSVRGIIHNGVPEKNYSAILAYIGDLNAKVRLVRLSTVAGRVVIQSEIARSRCKLENVLESLGAVMRYASSCCLEISVLASDDLISHEFLALRYRALRGNVSATPPDQAFDFDITANRLGTLRETVS